MSAIVDPLIVVCSSGDVGSAVAHRLYLQGHRVVLHDEPRPAHPRRGMAFTNALFVGRSELEGVCALHVGLEQLMPGMLEALEYLPVTAAPLEEVCDVVRPDVVVDARMRKRARASDQRSAAWRLIGLGPGFEVGANCDVAVETARGELLGTIVRHGKTLDLAGGPRLLDDVGRERFVYADAAGVWRTDFAIGDRVSAGQQIGRLAGSVVAAPLAGMLRGLTHDDVLVPVRQKLVEIDPSQEPEVLGVGGRPREIARGVAQAIGTELSPAACFFDFERDMERSLGCMPLRVRMVLDVCGIKVSLTQWRLWPMRVRESVLRAGFERHAPGRRIAAYVRAQALRHALGPLAPVVADLDAWRTPIRVPESVSHAIDALGFPTISVPAWASLREGSPRFQCNK